MISQYPEKHEDCPACGAELKQLEYDAQYCGACQWPQNEAQVATEVTQAKRMREEHIIVKTTWNDVGQIEQLVMTPTHVMQRRVLNTMEKQVRDAMIELGWTPPTK